MTDYYCPEHKYNPPEGSGLCFCPRCEFPDEMTQADKEAAESAPCNHSAFNWNLQEGGTWICRGCGEVVEK